MQESLTRRTFLERAGIGTTGVMLGAAGQAHAAAGGREPVVDAVNRELANLAQRMDHDLNKRPDRLRELAAYMRILDSAMADHDLKKHLRRVSLDVEPTSGLAKMHGKALGMTADELLRRHNDRAARVPDVSSVKRAGRNLLESGELMIAEAASFDVLAAELEKAWNIAGVREFREGAHDPASAVILRDVQSRLNMARLCDAAASWGFLLGVQGLALSLIPPLAAVGLASTIAAVILDGFSTLAC